MINFFRNVCFQEPENFKQTHSPEAIIQDLLWRLYMCAQQNIIILF